jgi:hypothetical protein
VLLLLDSSETSWIQQRRYNMYPCTFGILMRTVGYVVSFWTHKACPDDAVFKSNH